MKSDQIRILVLGGGSSQIPLLSRCRERGYSVILADRDPSAPGRRFADHFEEASTFDHDAVSRAARRHLPAAILTVGTDQPVLTAAVVSHRLGLPFPLDVPTAQLVTNKRLMKRRFAELGIPTADWRIITANAREAALTGLSPPLVTKPVDSQGQRGVRKVSGPAEAIESGPGVLEYSRESTYLVEEYYPSAEVTVSGWVEAGKPVIYTMTDRITIETGASIGVCIAHRFPSVYAACHLETVTDMTRRIVEGFGIGSGPIYFQFLIGASGVFVNEIACRIGGAYEDRFVPRLSGIDLLDLLIDQAVGVDASPLPSACFEPAATHVSIPLLFCRPGVIASLSPIESVRSLPGVVAAEWLLPTGTQVRPIENSTQRAAYLIVEGSSAIEANLRLCAACDAMHAIDESGSELLMDVFESISHPEPDKPDTAIRRSRDRE